MIRTRYMSSGKSFQKRKGVIVNKKVVSDKICYIVISENEKKTHIFFIHLEMILKNHILINIQKK